MDWSQTNEWRPIKSIYGQSIQTLPEAQRTQGIESITQIITHGKYHFGDEMIHVYMYG